MVSNKDNILNKFLERNLYKLTKYTETVNNGKTFFTQNDCSIIEGMPQYYEIDEYGRTKGAIAIISKNTLSIRTEKHLNYPNPSGWSNIISNSGIFERCHCIAYNLSAKKNDKRNIFIGTKDLNKNIMSPIENDINNYIRNNENQYIRVLYRVTPKYKGKNQVPTGVLIEAKGIDTDYELCVFCYNVQHKIKFNYSDGSIKEDNRGFLVPVVDNIKRLSFERKVIKEKNIDFVVNTQTKKYHFEDCSILKNVDPKYLVDITTKEKSLIKDGYSNCKICDEHGKNG